MRLFASIAMCLFALAASARNVRVVAGGTPVSSSVDYYVDSQAGSDSNNGLSAAAPFQHLYKLTNYLASQNVTVYGNRTSLWREALFVPTNWTFKAYGTGGLDSFGQPKKPTVSGANILATNWSLTAGKTNTYEQTYSPPNFAWTDWITGDSTTVSNVLMVWDNSARMGVSWPGNTYGAGVISNVNQLDANWGNFYWDGTKIYISPFVNSSPQTNNHLYEVSVRNVAIRGYKGFLVEDWTAEKAYPSGTSISGYQLYGVSDGTFRRCIARWGSDHLFGVANTVNNASPLIFDSVYGWDMERNPVHGGTMFVAFKSSIVPSSYVYCTNSAVEQPTYDSTSIGFFSHDSIGNRVGGAASVKAYMSGGYGVNVANGVDASQTLAAPTNFTGINCLSSVSQGNAFYPSWYLPGMSSYNCTYGWAQPPTNAALVDGIIYESSYGISSIPDFIGVTNSIFQNVTNTVGQALTGSGFVAGQAKFVWSISNTFVGQDGVYIKGNDMTNLVRFSDWNRFYLNAKIAPLLTTLNDWKAANSGMDTNSTSTAITLPDYSIWPTNYARAVVADTPMMLVQPTNVTVLLTNSASFYIAAAGFSTLTYQWMLDGGTGFTNISGATSATYTKTMTNSDAGSYKCVVANSIGSCTSAVATLTVTQPFTWSPTNTASSGPALAWWEVETSYVTNSGVATLTDLTGNGYSLRSDASQGAHPARQSNVVGSYDAIYFRGDDFPWTVMTNGALGMAQRYDVILVAAITNAGTYVWSTTNSGVPGLLSYSDQFHLWGGGGPIDGAATYNQYIILDATADGASSNIRVNNSSVVSGNAGSTTTTGFTLGMRYDYAARGTMSFIGGMIFTNLQSGDRLSAFQYLTNRYGWPLP